MLVDLRKSSLTGKEAQETLEKAGITANRNTVPFDPRSPFVTSGVRIGTPAVTSRGMKENEMRIIARLIVKALDCKHESGQLESIREEVRELCQSFPLYSPEARH
jgi:glycine hydroxymethyltransferase